MAICEMCNTEKVNTGAFRTSEKQWTSVCGGCKVRWVLADPVRCARLEQTIRAALLVPISPKAEA